MSTDTALPEPRITATALHRLPESRVAEF